MRDLCEGCRVCILGEPVPQADGLTLKPFSPFSAHQNWQQPAGAAKHAFKRADEDLSASGTRGDDEGQGTSHKQ